jgi:uracil-DNA glycosylase
MKSPKQNFRATPQENRNDNAYRFGYPQHCTKCKVFSKTAVNLQVDPYYQSSGNLRLMLIGQDPTIFNDPERVKQVLMLNESNGQLALWLKDLIGKGYDFVTLYATNLVKCTFGMPPSTTREGGLKFLQPYFEICKDYLVKELNGFAPNCVLTLGEPAHMLFRSILDNAATIPETMQTAFSGRFIKARLGELEFDYSPCLHIKTFRVAEVYGEKVGTFKEGMKSYFSDSNVQDIY